jgi:hypothetical protein
LPAKRDLLVDQRTDHGETCGSRGRLELFEIVAAAVRLFVKRHGPKTGAREKRLTSFFAAESRPWTTKMSLLVVWSGWVLRYPVGGYRWSKATLPFQKYDLDLKLDR